jgi:hypothetical protein
MGNSETQKLAELSAAIERINKRLDVFEQAPPHSALRTPHSNHPSLDKLNIAEAIADSIFGVKEKACTFEPSKPCDHCSMCNSRGF